MGNRIYSSIFEKSVFWTGFFLLLILFSCKDDSVQPSIQNTYAGYFPLDSGFWIEYHADSIVHLDADDPFNLDTAIRSYSFELREEIDEGFVDAEGDWAYRVSRYKRESNSLPWEFLNLWTAKITNSSAQRVEDNIRFVKLSFPINERKTWNGNAYNYYVEEDYAYSDIHQPYSLNGISFDSTVTVLQNDFTSNVNRILKQEVYANHVGLIFKQQDSLNTVNLPNGTVLILNGTEYKLRILDYKH
ncbi:MAG TPA: hypothetical protein PLU53_06285 [Bacteroidia bacterium]|nr:hypothetical protein [Bacteroidia bacterium]